MIRSSRRHTAHHRGLSTAVSRLAAIALATALTLPSLGASSASANDPLDAFADPGLRRCVESSLDQRGADHVAEITSLSCNWWGTVTLAGIGTLSGLQTLQLYGNNVATLPTLVGVAFPAGLQHLAVANTHITTLAGAAFPDSLQTLSLFGTQIATLMGVTFPNSLQRLDLTANSITTLTDASFPDGLHILGLGDNRIADLTGAAFPNNLQSISLYGNQIASLSGAIFPSGLDYLSLRWNRIADLAGARFPSSLQTLELYGNKITTLAGARFPDGLPELDVSDNQITDLNGVTFPEGLESLSLSGNQIADLSGAVFPRGLHGLSLSGNRIANLVGAVFPDGLLSISLGDNLTSLDGMTFPRSLQDLGLVGNQIAHLVGVTFPGGLETLRLDAVLRDHVDEATFLGRTSVCFPQHTEWTFSYACEDRGPSIGAQVPASAVTLTPESGTVVVGGTVRLSATVSPSYAMDKTVTWASSNTAVAEVDTNGIVTGIAAGTATITATTKSAGRIARAAITVTAPESSDGDEPDPYPGAGTTNAIAATGIVLSATTAKVMVGATATLLAALVPPGAHSSPVIWVSANPKVATVGDDGVVRGIRAGKTTVTATSGHLSASAAITVTKAKTRVQAKVPTSSKAGARVSVKVKVAAGGGGKLGGKLRVTLVKGRITLSKTVPVKAKSNAKYVTVPLPKVTQPGKYKLTIVYLGTTSHAKTTIVKRITIK